MTHIKIDAKEKAKELVSEFTKHTRVFHESSGWEDYIDSAKMCALIVVDECLKAVESDWGFMQIRIKYWQKVKNEIEQL
jgi:hypothetical protein